MYVYISADICLSIFYVVFFFFLTSQIFYFLVLMCIFSTRINKFVKKKQLKISEQFDHGLGMGNVLNMF